MKHENTYARKLAALLKSVRQRHAVADPPHHDPVTRMVLGFLEWNAPRKGAADAYARVMHTLVDNNDLRVSRPHEVVALLGPRYPRVEERAARLHESLQEVFVREHAVSLDSLIGKPKKQLRAYLDTLPGMVPYVAAQVALLSFQVHTVPVDDLLADLLKQASAAPPDATPAEIEPFLERHVKAEDALATHLAMNAWADVQARAARPAPVASPRPAAGGTARATTRNSTKKTTKRTTKKVTKKTTSRPARRSTKRAARAGR